MATTPERRTYQPIGSGRVRAWLMLCMVVFAVSCAAPQRYTASDEAIYLERFNALRQSTARGGGLSGYDPLEAVPGADPVVPMPHRDGSVRVSAKALDQAEAYVAARNSSAFIVAEDGAIVRETYFQGNDAATPINSKSLAKPLTAVLIGRAIEMGYIRSLDQQVSDFITEWRRDPCRSKITLRQLLGMRSGLARQGDTSNPQSVMAKAYLHPRHDEVIIQDYPLTDEPGTRYEYSNANAELIAPIIERATGMRYAQFISKALLDPLGAAGGKVWVNRKGGMAHSGCCILMPPRTWVKIGQLLLQDGQWRGERLLPDGYVSAMLTPDPVNPHYGLGVWVTGPYVKWRGSANPSLPYGKTLHSAPYLDREIFLFDGNSNQVVYMIPALDMVVLRTGGDTPERGDWDNVFLPNLLIGDAVASGKIAAPEPQLRKAD